jgi:putative oxidoreductase
MKPFNDPTYAILRIVVGVMFFSHGAQKIFGVLGGTPPGAPGFVVYGAGGVELITGALVAVGVLTRWAAFIASGEMAVAYWMVHAFKAWHPIVNQGELAVIYCFVFLFIASHGAGIWSIEGRREGA